MQGMNNFSRFRQLREQHPLFCYESYHFSYQGNSLDIGFDFRLSDEIKFSPKIRIPWKSHLFKPYEELSGDVLDRLVFHIGMIEMISYWKAACPPEVEVRSGSLTEEQLDFWKKLFFNGLGEFFYLNGISTSQEEFMHISTDGKSMAIPFACNLDPKAIVPAGGGKDSAVTMEFLNRGEIDWIPMVINPRGATRDVITAAGKSEVDTIVIERQIDPTLIRLNSEGYLNGHTPFSALLAFYSLLTSYLTGRAEIVLSNESSASEPTIPGTNINHQYSKSIEFESDFRDYCKTFISPAFNYFSFLRPLSEIQIAALFSRMPRYFEHFKSCNVGSKTDSWCCKCSKCLFTYIILSPFLEKEELNRVFGKDLLDDPSLKPILDELTGRAEIKPFECIGTIDEVNAALEEAIGRYGEEKLPALLEMYASEKEDDRGVDIFNYFLSFGKDHFLPSKYLKIHGFQGK